MPIAINGSGTLTGLSVGGLENGIITPAELSTGGPGWDSSSNLTNVASINAGPLAGMRNAIINGNFDIWQRGTSFTSSEYGADRWVHRLSGATTHTATRQAFTAGQTDVPGEPTYFCRTVVSSVAGAGNSARLDQQIENVRTFAGQQVTLSFWAKADAIKNIAVTLQQVFGSGGSPSAAVDFGVTKIAIGTSWQKVTVTATVPSISGKTLGTDNNHSLVAIIWFDAGSTYNTQTDSLGQQSGTFDIAQVQVEPGAVATAFERRPIGMELSLCQRYFQQGTFQAQAYNTTGDFIKAGFSFSPTMRTAPSIAFTETQQINTSSASQMIDSNASDFFIRRSIVSTGNGFFNGGYTASAEL